MATGFYKVKLGLNLGRQASDPSSPQEGDHYTNSTSNKVKVYVNAAWREVLSNSDTQVVTNKDVDGGTASNANRVTLPKSSRSSLDALTRKEATIVYATDTKKVYIDDGSILKEISTDASALTDDELVSLKYKAAVGDNFLDAPSSDSTVDVGAGKTDSTLYSPTNTYYRLAYDASKTVTGTGTAMTISGAPSFTIKAGDMLRVSTEARRITSISSQTSVTIESAFTSDPSAAACLVAQAVHTKDLNAYAADGLAISSVQTGNIDEVLVSYEDTETLNDVIFDQGATALIAYDASSNGSSWSAVTSRNVSLATDFATRTLPTANTNLYLRFFANKSSGTGSVNLLGYRARFHSQSDFANGVRDSRYDAAVDAVVGSSAQVATGAANYTSLQAAHDALTAGKKIVLLDYTSTENLSLSKQITIEGKGFASVLSGNLTLTSSADACLIKNIKVAGNITLDAGSDNSFVREVWLTGTVTNNGTNNSILTLTV